MPKDYIIGDDGKVIVGESTQQHVIDLIVLHKGWHKFYPFIGVGIDDYIDEEDTVISPRQAIKTEVQNDGATGSVEFKSFEELQVNVNYRS